MTKQTYIVVRENNYWVVDESLPQARNRYKRLTGKYPSSRASIIALTGAFEHLDNIQVNDLGDLIYHKDLSRLVIQ